MSQWTQIMGCIRLSMSPYTKNEGAPTLDYPKEQCKIIDFYHSYDNEPTYITMEVSSLPAAKRVIKPLIEQIMPQGEDKLTYFLNQETNDCSDCHNFFITDLEKETYEELCKEKFGSAYNPVDYQLDVVQINDSFTLTIADNIRDCSSDELYDAFIELFKAFDAANIYIDGCAIEWNDSWYDSKSFKIARRSSVDKIVFEVRNIPNDKIEKFDVFKYDRNYKLVKEEIRSVKDLLKGDKD